MNAFDRALPKVSDRVRAEVARLCGIIASTDDYAAYTIAQRDLEHAANCEDYRGAFASCHAILVIRIHLAPLYGKPLERAFRAECARKRPTLPAIQQHKAA